MKIYNWSILLLFFFGLGFFSNGQEKHALIVAIGTYDSSTNWPNINSIKDVPIITKTLKSQGFGDIDVLLDEQATRYGILMAFKSFRAKLKKGDIVCIHFSSHGQQLEDFNGDETSDGLDESIVPYDAPLS